MVPPPPPWPGTQRRFREGAQQTQDSKVKCSACSRWAWTSKLQMYQNTCLCGAPFSNLPPPEAGDGEGAGPKAAKGKGNGKHLQQQAALEVQLEAVIKGGGSEQAKAAQALLDATRAAGKKSESAQPITQQVTAAASKVQKAQTAFDKAQSQQLKLTMELEKCKGTLQDAAATLARAETERARLFRSMVPSVEAQTTAQAGVSPNTIDLSALMSAQAVDESMFTLSLGEEFSNADGLIPPSDVAELDKRKKAVMEALMHTLRTTFGEAHDKLEEHKEKLAEMREKITKRRRENSPGPPPVAGAGAAAGAAAAPAGDAAAQAAGQAPAVPAAATAPAAAPGGDAPAAATAPGAPDAVGAARLAAIESKLKEEAEALLATARGEPAFAACKFGPYMFAVEAGYIGMLSAAYESNGKSKAGGITMGTLKKYKANAAKLANVGTLVSTIQGPWLAIGDWNMTPKELASTGWLAMVNGAIITPTNTEYTCALGSGRMLDYMVASQHAVLWVESLLADFQAVEEAGKAHYGLELQLNFDASRARAWIMRRKLSIKSPPPLQYSLYGEDEDEFFTDEEETDVPDDNDDEQVAVAESELDTYASIQAEWSAEAKDLLWQQ
ncbi:unnamed protein product, partial [Prorocentrum cordatum]